MALDRFGKLYAWGDGTYGCMGFGDNKRRATPQQLPFFNDKRKVVDVSCGELFTCVIAFVYDDMIDETIIKRKVVNTKVVKEQLGVDDEWKVSVRPPICG